MALDNAQAVYVETASVPSAVTVNAQALYAEAPTAPAAVQVNARAAYLEVAVSLAVPRAGWGILA